MSHGFLPAKTVAAAAKAAISSLTANAERSGGAVYIGDKLATLRQLQSLSEAVADGEVQPAYVSVTATDFDLIDQHYGKPAT